MSHPTRSAVLGACCIALAAACERDARGRVETALATLDSLPPPELLPYDPPAANGAVEEADSAGVRIVRNRGRGEWGAALLPVREELRIDPFDGDGATGPHAITAVWIGDDGKLYVSLGERGLRIFDADGRPLHRIATGRDGAKAIASILTGWVRRDSLFVYDPDLRRLSLFDTATNLVASWDDPRRAGGLVVPAAPAPEGWIAEVRLPMTRPDVPTGEPFVRPPRRLHRFEPGADTVGPALFQIPRSVRYGAPGTEAGLEPALFESQPYWSFDAAGRLFITSARDYHIDIHDSAGRLAVRIAREYTPAAIGPDAIAHARRLVEMHFDTASGVEPRLRRSWLEAIDRGERLPAPAHMPPLGRLHVAADGAFWVERLDAVPPARYQLESLLGSSADRPSRWDLFDAAGRFLGTTDLPPGFAPLRLRGTRVAGVLRARGSADRLLVLGIVPPADTAR